MFSAVITAEMMCFCDLMSFTWVTNSQLLLGRLWKEPHAENKVKIHKDFSNSSARKAANLKPQAGSATQAQKSRQTFTKEFQFALREQILKRFVNKGCNNLQQGTEKRQARSGTREQASWA